MPSQFRAWMSLGVAIYCPRCRMSVASAPCSYLSPLKSVSILHKLAMANDCETHVLANLLSCSGRVTLTVVRVGQIFWKSCPILARLAEPTRHRCH